MNSSNELEATQTAENNIQISLDEETITLNYLQQHHDFFSQHQDLLMSLNIPHLSGGAVSLIERQINILREQNAHLRKNLDELVSIAKENENANRRLHTLTLALLACRELNEINAVLKQQLCDEFSVDQVALKLLIEPLHNQAGDLFANPDSKLAKELEKLLNKRQPACGFFENLPLEPLFEEKTDSLASLAIIPLFVEKNRCFGALVLGSQNDSRFRSDMGTLFLEKLGETLSHVLVRYLPL